MKKLVTYLSLFICACFLFISCGRNYSVSFTKRHYRNGYFVNFSNEKSSLKERKKILAQKEKIDLTINDKPQSFSTNESLADNISSPISKSENSEINTNKQKQQRIITYIVLTFSLIIFFITDNGEQFGVFICDPS